MPATKFDKESIKNTIVGKVQRYNGLTIEEASPHQIYKAVAVAVFFITSYYNLALFVNFIITNRAY